MLDVFLVRVFSEADAVGDGIAIPEDLAGAVGQRSDFDLGVTLVEHVVVETRELGFGVRRKVVELKNSAPLGRAINVIALILGYERDGFDVVTWAARWAREVERLRIEQIAATETVVVPKVLLRHGVLPFNWFWAPKTFFAGGSIEPATGKECLFSFPRGILAGLGAAKTMTGEKGRLGPTGRVFGKRKGRTAKIHTLRKTSDEASAKWRTSILPYAPCPLSLSVPKENIHLPLQELHQCPVAVAPFF